MSSSWGSSQSRDWTQVSHTASRFFTIWATGVGRGVAPPFKKPSLGCTSSYSYILVFLHLCGINLLEGIDYTCYHQVLSFHSLLNPLQSCLHLHHVWVFSKPWVISLLLNLVVSSASSSYLASLQLFVQLTNFFLAIFPTLDFQYATLFWISFFLPGYCFSVSSASWFFFSLPIF